MRDARVAAVLLLLTLLGSGCTNDPYPESDDREKVLYTNYQEPPKTLDPAVAYSTADHIITGAVYDTLLQYHSLARPPRVPPGPPPGCGRKCRSRPRARVAASSIACACRTASSTRTTRRSPSARRVRPRARCSPPTSRSSSCGWPIRR